jgi:hypothetical protein
MKLTVGTHPDIPFPFSNGPEDPTPPPMGLSEAPRLADQQLLSGFMAMGALVSYWRGRSALSGSQLSAIAAWGLGQNGWLDSSIVSRIENARQSRGCSLKNLLAFDAANQAIWTWQIQGQQAAWGRFGPHTVWGLRDQWLQDAIWLPVADEPEHPLEFEDFAAVLVGRSELPYLGTVSLGQGDAAAMSERLSDLLNALLTATNLGPREALKALLTAYPTKDPDRQSRLMALVMGSGSLSRDELEAELYALAEAIRSLRDLAPGGYGPGDLARELSAGQLPSG